MIWTRWIAGLGLALWMGGCTTDDSAGDVDTGVTDTDVADTGVTDTLDSDTADTRVTDTAPDVEDTTQPDTADIADTTHPDTAPDVVDTTDTAAPDASSTGGPCEGVEDCAAGNVCVDRVCLRMAGESCESSAQCEDICLGDTCAPRSGVRGPCGNPSHCTAGLDCVDDVCLVADGGPCDSVVDCVSDSCGDPDGQGAVCGVCGPETACNTLPDSAGFCGGACVEQFQGLDCRGEVVAGLCYGRSAPSLETTQRNLDGLVFSPVVVPEGLYSPGDEAQIELRVTNITAAPVSRSLRWKDPTAWSVTTANFTGWTTIDLDPGESLAMTATVEAVEPNAFSRNFTIFSFTVGERESYSVFGVVGFASATGHHECAGTTFPPNWCPAGGCGRNGYYSAVCCDDVFYPGASCCTNDDCHAGVCADGYCVDRLPQFGSANTMPMGYHKILLVFADIGGIPRADDICTNHYPSVHESHHLDGVEAWLDAMIRERTGRDDKLLNIEWTVIGGLDTDDFVLDGQYTSVAYRRSLEAYLQDHECLTNFFDYDKIIALSNRIDINFGGQAFANGQMVMRYHNNPYLMVHELMHTWGARDTYLNIGNSYQYQGDLMGNYLGNDPIPDDGVMYAEIGYGDIDDNGIIDVFEFAHTPDSLIAEVGGLALDMGRRTVIFDVRVDAVEGGVVKRLKKQTGVTVRLPQFAMERQLTNAVTEGLNFSLTAEQHAAVKAAGELTVTIEGEHLFTNAAFERTVITLDDNVTIPVESVIE